MANQPVLESSELEVYSGTKLVAAAGHETARLLEFRWMASRGNGFTTVIAVALLLARFGSKVVLEIETVMVLVAGARDNKPNVTVTEALPDHDPSAQVTLEALVVHWPCEEVTAPGVAEGGKVTVTLALVAMEAPRFVAFTMSV